jgi:hypothetical protein
MYKCRAPVGSMLFMKEWFQQWGFVVNVLIWIEDGNISILPFPTCSLSIQLESTLSDCHSIL